jgi:molybdenum cofactor synthesis domain-containing protein
MTAERAWQRRAAVLTVSDRSAAGEREDVSGALLAGLLEQRGWVVSERRVVPDEPAAIAAALTELAGSGVPLVLTTGGTGLSPRDVTPDATRSVADREVPGIAEALRAAGMGETPHAMLSRATAAVRGRTLIVNLPGSPRGAESGFRTLEPVVDHAIGLIAGDAIESGHRVADDSAARREPPHRAAGSP